MSLANRSRAALLNSLFGKTSDFGALATRPDVYVGFSSTTPTKTGTNVTEPSGGGYARKIVNPADWNTATNADPAVTTNANAITLDPATADWLAQANLTHAVFYDAVTAGNFLGFGALGTPKNILNGDTPRFPAGDISVSSA